MGFNSGFKGLKLRQYGLERGTLNCILKAIMVGRRWGNCPTADGDKMLPVSDYL